MFREVAAEVEQRLSAPMDSIILSTSSKASPAQRIGQALRAHLEAYRDEARIMGVIEQVSRFDPQVTAMRFEGHVKNRKEVAASIRNLQEHGLADARLDPTIAAAALGSMTYRFPEMWFVQGLLDCDFDEGVEQLTLLFVRALGLEEDGTDGVDRDAPRGTAALGSETVVS